MTTPSGPDGRRSTDEAIAAGMAAGDTEAVLRAIATADVMVPQGPAAPGEEPPEGALALPVVEQDETQFVPVFTSEAAMQAAGSPLGEAVPVAAAALGASWPSDDLWLAVNPGTEDGVTLPPEVVKALPAYVTSAG